MKYLYAPRWRRGFSTEIHVHIGRKRVRKRGKREEGRRGGRKEGEEGGRRERRGGRSGGRKEGEEGRKEGEGKEGKNHFRQTNAEETQRMARYCGFE